MDGWVRERTRLGLQHTYRRGIADNVLHIARRVDRARGIGAFLGERGVAGNHQREALAIDDVPVEGVNLGVDQNALPNEE